MSTEKKICNKEVAKPMLHSHNHKLRPKLTFSSNALALHTASHSLPHGHIRGAWFVDTVKNSQNPSMYFGGVVKIAGLSYCGELLEDLTFVPSSVSSRTCRHYIHAIS